MKNILIGLDYFFHPFKYYNELKTYREDYEKEVASVNREIKRLKNKMRDLKLIHERELNDKDKIIKVLIKEIKTKRNEYKKIILNKQKSINTLRGKYGSAIRYLKNISLKESDK